LSDNGYPTAHEGKAWFRDKVAARASLRHHNVEQCPKCPTGRYIWRVYLCRQGGFDHWHRGHKPVNGWARLKLAEAAR
jgi:hypothetical protein